MLLSTNIWRRNNLGDRMSSSLGEKRVSELHSYIRRFQPLMDRHIGRYINPQGKRILVVGTGWGTEVLWALEKGAAYVVGLDPVRRSDEPLRAAAPEISPDRFAFMQASTDTAPEDIGTFDYVISNNVFEHVFNLSKVLASTRRFMPGRGSRLAVFADPLFCSSAGSHLPIGPWEHLVERQDILRSRFNSVAWALYRDTLNGMTITTFLDAVREAGLIIEDLYVVPDRARAKFPEIQSSIPPGLKPMDLCIEGIGCLLAFPENL